jgi:hypothetical protein
MLSHATVSSAISDHSTIERSDARAAAGLIRTSVISALRVVDMLQSDDLDKFAILVVEEEA